MMETLKRYPLLAALALAALVLLAVAAYEVATARSPTFPSTAPAQRTVAVQAKLLPPLAQDPPEQAYPETAARPLFTPTRRPAPAAPTAAASTMAKGQYILSGVTIAGPVRIALLREKSSGRVLRVEQGREFNGITVALIERERVTLAQGGDREVVSLQVQKGAQTAGAATVAGPFSAPAPASAPAQPAPPSPPAESSPLSAPVNPGANPAARAPGPIPGMGGFGPFAPAPTPAPASAPSAATATSSDQSAPLSPEELLARRRARRTQQNQ